MYKDAPTSVDVRSTLRFLFSLNVSPNCLSIVRLDPEFVSDQTTV